MTFPFTSALRGHCRVTNWPNFHIVVSWRTEARGKEKMWKDGRWMEQSNHTFVKEAHHHIQALFVVPPNSKRYVAGFSLLMCWFSHLWNITRGVLLVCNFLVIPLSGFGIRFMLVLKMHWWSFPLVWRSLYKIYCALLYCTSQITACFLQVEGLWHPWVKQVYWCPFSNIQTSPGDDITVLLNRMMIFFLMFFLKTNNCKNGKIPLYFSKVIINM